MRMYYRRPWMGRILAFLIAIPVLAYVGRLVSDWLIPILPLIGAAILVIVFWAVGFRRRY
ncbi:hypothetical protein BTM25_47970 [Actinomadura rubteroloni]|uniref:DUF4175 domain-containing protein n=1 Tax=Actinomadura rubteroloni TaxID=1926885 RepID=A0A2P4UF44_9ACTN|nr:hypothetical protein [Actinomadura rubteroloni]POM23638.1 hypothetical protein BTM25_47970 [Actinomadura rubteroloni]